MTRRRLGSAAGRSLAASPSIEAALSALADGPYGQRVHLGQALADAQRAVLDTLVWNLRVLGGWAPRDGVAMLRVLMGAVEIANVDDHVQRLAGLDTQSPYRLGGLATAWPRCARATTTRELRQELTASPWGDPGGETPLEIGLTMRASLADRVIAAVPAAAVWAAGATALLVAREAVAQPRELPAQARVAASRVLGPAALSATTLTGLTTALPTSARWALVDVHDPTELWRAEARWWTRVERDGFTLARCATAGPRVLVGTVAVLAADAWRVRAALELAARGGEPLEAFDAVA